MEIPAVRGMISISRGDSVMPMEIFLSCVGDLATLGGLVGHDVGPVTPQVCFLFFFFLFVREAMDNGMLYSGSSLAL